MEIEKLKYELLYSRDSWKHGSLFNNEIYSCNTHYEILNAIVKHKPDLIENSYFLINSFNEELLLLFDFIIGKQDFYKLNPKEEIRIMNCSLNKLSLVTGEYRFVTIRDSFIKEIRIDNEVNIGTIYLINTKIDLLVIGNPINIINATSNTKLKISFYTDRFYSSTLINKLYSKSQSIIECSIMKYVKNVYLDRGVVINWEEGIYTDLINLKM